jgi:hypothetical protein
MITEENKYMIDLIHIIRDKLDLYLDKLPNITPSIRYETLKMIMYKVCLNIISDRSKYLLEFPDFENMKFIQTWRLKNLDPLINHLLVDTDIYKIKNINGKDKFLLLSQHEPQLYQDIEELNNKICNLCLLNKEPIKKYIVEEVNNLFEIKYKSDEKYTKQAFLKYIYPFLVHYQTDWNLTRFLSYANNR